MKNLEIIDIAHLLDLFFAICLIIFVVRYRHYIVEVTNLKSMLDIFYLVQENVEMQIASLSLPSLPQF